MAKFIFKNFFTLGLVVVLGFFFTGASFAGTKKELVFAVHPFKKPRELIKMFRPLTEEISRQLKMPVKVKIGKDYHDVINMYKAGKADFGYFGPSTYVTARKSIGISPLARIKIKGKSTFNGVILVKSNSKITSVGDLRGKKFAFGDPESTLSHYVPHYMLIKKGIYLKDLGKYAFTGKHDNVALGVLKGNYDAGGLKPGVAKKYLSKGLKILAKSQPIPNHLFGARKSLGSALITKLQHVLLNMDVKILQSIKKSITGTEIPKDKDYDALMKLMALVDKDKH